MTANQETMTVRDLAKIADHDDADRIAEYLGDDWASQPKSREVVVAYPEHNRLMRLDSETSYGWADES